MSNMNLFLAVIVIGVIAVVGYFGYKWWSAPVEQFPPMGGFLVRSQSLYGGYPTPLIYKKRDADQYIVGLFDPQGGDGVGAMSEKEVRVLLDSHPEKYDIYTANVDELATIFAENIRAYQAKKLLDLAQIDPENHYERLKEVAALSLQPEELIADRIAFVRDQLA